ncbi:MAG: hypothetical protein VXZ82_24925 [Planctomycetota bacterium]|nr:hypothetical protein [Planctomycetota bacterium]
MSDRLQALKRRVGDTPGVVAVGVDDSATQPGIKVYFDSQASLDANPLPGDLDGFRVTVVVGVVFQKQDDAPKNRSRNG